MVDSQEEIEAYCRETMIIAHQECEIAKRYGIEEAGKVNYGWGIDEGKNITTVESKIYGHNEILVTVAGNSLKYEDSWGPYIVDREHAL